MTHRWKAGGRYRKDSAVIVVSRKASRASSDEDVNSHLIIERGVNPFEALGARTD